ncbi:PLG [Branchiostoma lanceolatum]|uniref:PLG protein n=1 Tax=Branchiostoma lanceolatum TaxID=7740 RepID=A0A8K0EL43_BRALA|nr:PLG [Branchiostoma lanceolatum]
MKEKGLPKISDVPQPSPTNTPTLGCPISDYVKFNGVCYKDVAEGNTFDGARQRCAADGGLLAMPKDSATNTFIHQLGDGRAGRWLGLTDTENEGQWVFEDGQTLASADFSNWRPGEPNNNANKEHCAYVFDVTHIWNDAECNARVGGFVCQLDQDVLPGANVNIALGKPAFQSTVVWDMVGGLAVDGNTNTDYYAGSCQHNDNEHNPSWWVDLGKSYTINRVVIFNRQDCCPERLNPFNIHIGDSNQVTSNPKCGDDYLIELREPSVSISCQGMRGRYVGVRLPGNYRTLTLCEVQVFSGSVSIPTGYTERAGSFYKVFRTGKDHTSAQQTCEADGGHLVVIKTESVNNFLMTLISDAEDYWIGLSDYTNGGTWMWSDGTRRDLSCDFTNWAPGEPTNGGLSGGQDCVHLWGLLGHKWDDDYCYRGKYFICQIGPREESSCPEETCGLSSFRHVPQTDCGGVPDDIDGHVRVTLQFCADACCADSTCLSFQFNSVSTCILKRKLCSTEKQVSATGNMYDRLHVQESCRVGNGAAYRGTLSETATGKTCQRWDSQTPHQHDRTAANYPSGGLEQNYCRNPDNWDGLWCYTTDPNHRWDYCDVPLCDGGSYEQNHTIRLSGSPYNVTNQIIVGEAATLTIEAGVRLLFAEGIGMTVWGRLIAVGSTSKRIIFDRKRNPPDDQANNVTRDHSIRLLGPTVFEGRVQVKREGMWGSLCRTYRQQSRWSEAKVVCRQLGFASGRVESRYRFGTGRMAVSYLQCHGYEKNIYDCNHDNLDQPPRCPTGRNRNDLGVVCYGVNNKTGVHWKGLDIRTTDPLMYSVLKNVDVLYGGATSTTGAIVINSVSPKLYDVVVKYSRRAAIHVINPSTPFQMSNSDISDNHGVGILVSNPSQNITVSSTTVARNFPAGMYVSGARNAAIISINTSTFIGNSGAGLMLSGAPIQVTVTDSIFNANSHYGLSISFDHVTNLESHGCHFDHNGLDGVHIRYTSVSSVRSITVMRNGGAEGNGGWGGIRSYSSEPVNISHINLQYVGQLHHGNAIALHIQNQPFRVLLTEIRMADFVYTQSGIEFFKPEGEICIENVTMESCATETGVHVIDPQRSVTIRDIDLNNTGSRSYAGIGIRKLGSLPWSYFMELVSSRLVPLRSVYGGPPIIHLRPGMREWLVNGIAWGVKWSCSKNIQAPHGHKVQLTVTKSKFSYRPSDNSLTVYDSNTKNESRVLGRVDCYNDDPSGSGSRVFTSSGPSLTLFIKADKGRRSFFLAEVEAVPDTGKDR